MFCIPTCESLASPFICWRVWEMLKWREISSAMNSDYVDRT